MQRRSSVRNGKDIIHKEEETSPASDNGLSATPANIANAISKQQNESNLSLKEIEEAAMLIIDKHLQSNDLVHQQIASYNYFISVGIPTIVKNSDKTYSCKKDKGQSSDQEIHTIEFLDCKIQRRMIWTDKEGIQHKLTPNECRLRDLTYAVDIWANVRKVVSFYDENGKEKVKRGKINFMKIGQIPVMVKSDVCMLKGLTEKDLYALKEDPSDPGGYFIVAGKEKVLIAQDRAAVNQPFVFMPMCDSKYQYEAEIRSSWSPTTDKICVTWIRVPLSQSGKELNKRTMDQNDVVMLAKNVKKLSLVRSEILKNNLSRAQPGLVATIPKCRKDIPLLILYRALNFENDKDVWKTLCLSETSPSDDLKEALRPTFQDPESLRVKTQEEALLFIGKYSAKHDADRREKISLSRDIISREVLPHVGKGSCDDGLKGYHLGDMVTKLMNVMIKGDPCDDRDHLKNKRFDMAGPLLSSLFKTLFKNVQFTSKLAIDRKIEHKLAYEAKDVLKWDIIEKGMVYALATGNWGDKRKIFSVRTGVSQLLNRVNPIATLSHLRRVHSPVNRLVRMTPPRHLHNTFFGILCPSETPEGEQVGLVKNLSAMAYVTVEMTDDERIVEYLERMGTLIVEKNPLSERNTQFLKIFTKIYLNGLLIGSHKYPAILLKLFKENRRAMEKEIPFEASIFHDTNEKEILIRTDAGRPMRPLLVVQDGKLKLQRKHIELMKDPSKNYGWNNLIKDGVVEVVDCSEVENCYIAMTPSDLFKEKNSTHTHCEIHPCMTLGVSAGLIPFSNHNQSPRNTYQSAMAKQSIGFANQNFHRRYDPSNHVLYYPQRPLVTSKGGRLCKYDEIPCGVNAIVAIASYGGYNQEDSLILNQSSLDRGMFRSAYYKTYHEDEINKEAGTEEHFEKLERRGRNGVKVDLSYMDDDGLHLTGSELKDEEIVIGKTKLLKLGDIGYSTEEHAVNKRDTSVLHRSCASSREYIDSTIIMDNADGYRMVKVRVRSTRIPQIGDKFASRHGQKGVIGMTYSQENMMFTKDGITPDIIINPHAIPSRMTIGHLIESIEGKRSALTGVIKDGTPFEQRESYDHIRKILEEYNFNGLGEELMYVGYTGQKIRTPFSIGPTYYQRLKHMTEDKIHLRGRGPMDILCRQPLGGINRDGGLRFGEMERDCTISHGAFKFLQERLMKVSDDYFMTICNGCGYVADMVPTIRPNERYLKCRNCRSEYQGSSIVNIPYAAKTFFQELMAMGVRVALCVGDTDEKPAKIVKEEKRTEFNVVSKLLNTIEDVGFEVDVEGDNAFKKQNVTSIYENFPKSL